MRRKLELSEAMNFKIMYTGQREFQISRFFC